MADVIGLEDALAEAVRSGDEAALGAVIARYTAYVGTIVRNIVGDALREADAKEIVADVFFTLWTNREKIRPGKLKAYLSRIARSRALDALRRRKQDVSLEDDALEIPVPGPEDALIEAQLFAALRAALNAMPEPDRSIFVRHYYYYQKTKEIAQQMGINIKTVQTKLCRGRETLRRMLEEGGSFGDEKHLGNF